MLLEPPLARKQPKKSSKWSCDILYVRINFSGLCDLLSNWYDTHKVLFIVIIKPIANIFLPLDNIGISWIFKFFK